MPRFSLHLPTLAQIGRGARACHLPFACLTLGLLALGLVWGLVFAPLDRLQGELTRIIYLHVPAAYSATLGYCVLGLCAFASLVWRLPLADIVARALAPVVLTAAIVTLVTGSLWAKPTWGVWWVWEARLTSMLLLALLTAGYIVVREATPASVVSPAASLVAVIGLINLPIIKFSVDWWASVHQSASLLRADGPTIHPSILAPLLVMLAAFTCGSVWLTALRVQTALLTARSRRLGRRPLSAAHVSRQSLASPSP